MVSTSNPSIEVNLSRIAASSAACALSPNREPAATTLANNTFYCFHLNTLHFAI